MRMSNNIYEETLDLVGKGSKISIDFKSRSLKINGKNVELAGNLGVEKYDDLDEWLDKLEDLYDVYKYSRPTRTFASRERRAKFKALSVSELVKECGHDALNTPISRDIAQASLEMFILLSLVNGSFKPEELFNKDWFYQGSDKSLIMRKDWFI